MHQPTSAIPAAGPPSPNEGQAARSSWTLRLLFALLAVALFSAGLTVSALVGYTAIKIVRGDGPSGGGNVIRVGPIEREGDGDLTVTNTQAWDKHGPIHILLLGLDGDDCAAPDGSARRADTMILVRVDPETGSASMLSIPRDLYVYIDAWYNGQPVGAKKINTAHVLGTQLDEQGEEIPHSGPRLVMRTIEENLGLSVHRYIRVDFEGFVEIVDALGGIEIDVPPSEDDPTIGLFDDGYPDGHCGTMTINFPPGIQTLDGRQALQYARSRKTTSDFDRSRRQMDVLEAIRQRGSRLGVLLDLPRLVPALRETIDTDLTADEIFSLARLSRGFDRQDVYFARIDENVVYDDILFIDNFQQYVLRLRSEPFKDLKARFLDPSLAIEPDPTEAVESVGEGEG